MNNCRLTSLFFILFLSLSLSSKAQDGETIFKTTCAACHKMSTGKFIGPGLLNIHKKRSEEWFDLFVKSSQTLINSGDEEAVKIFNEYNKTIMPDQALSDAELDALFQYIVDSSPADSDSTAEVVEEIVIPFEPTEEDILIGQALFTGEQRLENGGTSCISCHHVRNDNITAGGALAKDLSDVYDRLGSEGVQAMITGLPFPQMKSSYGKSQITEEEAYQLTAFLKNASEQRFYQYEKSYQNILLTWGILGAIILMGVFPLLWYNRKKDSVNKRIYERQIRSEN